MKTPLSACLCFALFLTLSNAHAADVQSTTQQAEPDYGRLAAGICNSSHRGLNRSQKMKRVVVNFMNRNNLSHNNPPTNADIIRMFNANKYKMKCRGLHFVTYLMREDLGTVVFDDFIDDEIFDENEQVFFDFNVVTGIYNPVTKKPEAMTVLDFIEKVAFHTRSIVGSDISRRYYEMVREGLIEGYGAKRFVELSVEEYIAGRPICPADNELYLLVNNTDRDFSGDLGGYLCPNGYYRSKDVYLKYGLGSKDTASEVKISPDEYLERLKKYDTSRLYHKICDWRQKPLFEEIKLCEGYYDAKTAEPLKLIKTPTQEAIDNRIKRYLYKAPGGE